MWIALLPDSTEGDFIEVHTANISPTRTDYQVIVPGFWVTGVEYGGQEFAQLEFPPVVFGGIGFPEREGERGWYDFPEHTQYPLLSESRYRNAISIATPSFRYPLSAMQHHPPQTAEQMEALDIDPAGARPGIPALRGLLAVAANSEAEKDLNFSLNVRNEEVVSLPRPLVPAGYEGTDDNTGYTPPQLIDHEFYDQFRDPYSGTEERFTAVSQAGVFAVSEFRLPLIEMVSALEIRVPFRFDMRVDHIAGTVDFDCPLPWDHWIFKQPFLNGPALREQLTARGQDILASRSARYLILTLSDYHLDLMPLAWWKNSKGLHIDFAFVGNDPEDDIARNRDAINDYLEAYFQEHFCHGVYVLIAGDRNAIPSGISDHIDDFPAYNYFGGDSDHEYQVIGNGTLASLYVGRLPVANADELENQVAKLLRYEQSPPSGDWPLEVTLAANSENDDGTKGVSDAFPSKYAAAVNAIADHTDYVLPATFHVLHAGASDTNAVRATNNDVVQSINRGTGHILYRGHGLENSWLSGWDGSTVNGASFTANHIDQLENSILPVVYSIACLNSRQRAGTYIARDWMRRIDHGAVAHYGASTLSYTSENHHRSRAIMRALFEDEFNRLGPALGQADRHAHAASGGGSTWRHNTFTYILHGCPELTIRQAAVPQTPLEIALNLVQSGVLINLAAEPGALVTVELANGHYTNGFTNAEGSLLIQDLQHLEDIRTIHVHANGHAYTQEQVQPAVPTRLELGTASDTDGGIEVRVQGSGRDYLIQVSDDLQSWRTLTAIQTDEGSGNYTDQPDAEERTRFYRGVRIP